MLSVLKYASIPSTCRLEKQQFYLVLGSKNFRCCNFASMRGKNAVNAGAFASILTMQWRKIAHPKRIRHWRNCLSRGESNPLGPILVKFPPFGIVVLARRQPCFALTLPKDNNFSAYRVCEFKKRKFRWKTKTKFMCILAYGYKFFCSISLNLPF